MFTVKVVARPDARMVEVPLEIEAELPRDFEGAALLSSSGLPRKVKIKAQRDALKLSTAYRADQLLADVVRTVLRGSPIDIERVQIAAKNFVRAVRERRQDGATLMVESNGRGRIQVKEAMPPPREARPAAPAVKRAVEGTVSDRITALERRLDQLEAKLTRGIPSEGGDRIASLEKRIAALEERPAGAGVGEPHRGVLKGRGTAIEPFAEGLRTELRDRVAAQRKQAAESASRYDKAAALAVEAERVLRAPAEGVSQNLLTISAQAAARVQALERVNAEVELYAASDLVLAERLVSRLVETPLPPDPTSALERQAQALVRAARKENAELRAWLSRAAALCGWELIDPAVGEPLSTQLHVAVDSGGDHVVRVAAPGVRRKDRSVLCRARVLVASEPHAAVASSSAEEIELLAEEFSDEQIAQRPNDATPPPIDDRPPTRPLTAPPAVPEPTQALAAPAPAAVERTQPLPASRPAVIERTDPFPVPPAAAGETTQRLAIPKPPPAADPPRPADVAPANPAAAPLDAAPPLSQPAPEVDVVQASQPPGLGDTVGAPESVSAAPTPASHDHSAPIVSAPPIPEPVPLDDKAVPAPDRDLATPQPAVAMEPKTTVANAETAAPNSHSRDDLALATEIVAAVDTEIDEDPEWALLARGPSAFPSDAAKPDLSSTPTAGDKKPEPDEPRE